MAIKAVNTDCDDDGRQTPCALCGARSYLSSGRRCIGCGDVPICSGCYEDLERCGECALLLCPDHRTEPSAAAWREYQRARDLTDDETGWESPPTLCAECLASGKWALLPVCLCGGGIRPMYSEMIYARTTEGEYYTESRPRCEECGGDQMSTPAQIIAADKKRKKR